MFRNITMIPALAALAALAAPAAALAQESAASPSTLPEGSTLVERSEVRVQARMAMHVTAHALEDLKQYVEGDEAVGRMFLRMVLLAKQESTALSCAAYELDEKAMVSAMLRTLAPLANDGENNVFTTPLNRALRQYNTILGGELAQFAYDPDVYCNYGQQMIDELDDTAPEEGILVLRMAG